MIKGVHYLSRVGLATGITIAAVVPVVVAQQNAQGNFPDTQNYWAKPFIAALAQRNVVHGYPDGTYRPDRPVEREEFAAIIREAFNQKPERQISSGSAYRDVPKGYWAAPAIKEAYEMGFMTGYPDNTFRPGQPVTRAEALTSLARNLELSQRVPSTDQNAAAPAQQNQAAAQSTPRQQRRPIVLPIAALSLMQPLMNVPAVRAATQPAQVKAQAASTPKAAQVSASTTLKSYYDDADQIPRYARDAIASVTRAGVVVNHPNQRLLRPNQPTTRGEMAAFIHQALVNKGQVPALANNATAKYIVGRDTER